MGAAVQPIIEPDASMMLAHVEHVFGGWLDGYQDGLIELAWTDAIPDQSGRHRLNHAEMFETDRFDDLVAKAVSLNSTPGVNVYIGAWLRLPDTPRHARSRDEHAWACTAAYVDLDAAGAASEAKNRYGWHKPTWITVTGREPHLRAQLWWRLDEPVTDHAAGEALMRGLAAAMRGDDTICNPGRVMRLAGSIAWPVKPGRVLEVTRNAPLREPGAQTYPAGSLAKAFPAPAGAPATGMDTRAAAPTSQPITSAIGPRRLSDGRERYMRDTVLACLIEYCGQYGAEPTAQELFDLCWPQYQRGVDLARPGRGMDELADKCATALRRFAAGQVRGVESLDKAVEVYRRKRAARQEPVTIVQNAEQEPAVAPAAVQATPFRWVDPRAIPPREWIYGSHYIRKFVSTTVSPGGIGKTSLIIAEALCIATGRPYLGIPVDDRTAVWIWNGEDPQDELDRRVMAAAVHFGLNEQDIAGRLFVDTGRVQPIVIAEKTRDGVVINAPLVEQVVATIRENQIGVMVIDPFIACHRVTENDNNEIERVAKTWAAIADATNCSIELVHHVRKTGGAEIQVEDGRGAVALLAAARAARALNRMSEEEGEKAGVEDHRFYFRADDGKANLAPPSAVAKWFRLVSFDLQNATGTRASDKVGVVEAWQWPDMTQDVTAGDMHAVRQKAAEGKYRADAQASDWIGFAIMDVLGREDTPGARAQAKALQALWLKSGALKEVQDKDDRRKTKRFIRPGGFNE